MEYGLIGAKLGHSYSKIIHEMLCGYHYDLCPLPTEEEARAFLAKRQFKAINVTIPYKKLVMEYCSYIDPRAKSIGAVNTVVNKNGLLYGYNTDYMGFAHLCDAHGVSFAGKTVVILGTGGTHNTTSAVARDKGAAKVLTVSRHPDPEKGELSYAEAVSSGAQIVINTTPAGMYPNVGVCNLDVAAMPDLEAVVDVVYNPDKTELILRAEEAGVPVAVGGLEMLVAQAVYAAEYFLDRKFEDAPVEIRRITAALRRDMLNIALIGMPSSGKTTLGRMLAKSLGRTFVDLDEEIVKTDGRSIPDIFAAEGEDGFRTKETAETQRFGKEGRQLISCGGGIVKKPENLRALHQNGIILFIDRPVDALAVGGGSVIDTAKAIAEKLGLELQIDDMDFDAALLSVQQGKADIVMAGVTVTDERKAVMDFSDSYATGIQSIIVPEGSDIASPDDLAGKKIGTQRGTTGYIYCSDDFGDENVVAYDDGLTAVQALNNGQVDAVVIDNAPAQEFVAANPGLKVLDTSYAEEDYAIGMAKGSSLEDAVNAALKELKADGTLQSIVDKYITAE